MTSVFRLASAVLTVLLVASVGSAQAPDAAMEKLRTDFEQAWNRGDAKALAALYTEDALTVNAEGVAVRGRSAIEKTMGGSFAGPLKGSTISIKAGASQALPGDMSLNEGTYTISGGKGPDGKPMTINGRYLNTAVKRGNAVLIAGSAAFIPQPPPGGAR
jgi:uncharacterized protein (TIGR02246 family)